MFTEGRKYGTSFRTFESVAEVTSQPEGRKFSGVSVKEPSGNPKKKLSFKMDKRRKVKKRRQKKGMGLTISSPSQSSNPSPGLGHGHRRSMSSLRAIVESSQRKTKKDHKKDHRKLFTETEFTRKVSGAISNCICTGRGYLH